jgi:hypothetical protein
MTTLEKFLEIEQLIEKHVHNPLVAGLLADAFAAQVTEIEKLKSEMERWRARALWDESTY